MRPDPNLTVAEMNELPDGKVDDRIWLSLIDATEPATLAECAPGVQAYIATRYLEWEVGNGGFNQYFFNVGYSMADEVLAGYEFLGLPGHAKLFREALATARPEDAMRESHRDGKIESFMETYDHTELEAFDERLYELGTNDGLRVAYIRAHPQEFGVRAR